MSLTRLFSAAVMTVICVFALSVVTKADTITFTTTLSGANEVPPRATNGTGTATVILDDVAGKVTITLSFSGLSAAVTGAHIHCCAAPGANASVVVPFDSFLTLSADKTSGSLTSFSFTLVPAGGLTVAQIIDGLKSGLAYVNVHTSTFPGGEIRGQLVAAGAAVPEPSTLLLLGTGLLTAASRLRKRRNRD